MDETWLYHYDPETKQQSMEWRLSGSPRSQKFGVQKSAEKGLVSIFWDQDGIVLIDYLPKDQYHQRGILIISAGAIEGNFEGQGKFTKGVLFLHDNTSTHRTLATQKKLAYLSFHYLGHPHYSPDLASSDCHLFPGLKKIERSPFFVRRGGHCCRGDLVARTIF